MRKQTVLFLLLVLPAVALFAQIDPFYQKLVRDLENATTFGYKGLSLDRADSSFFDPLVQGELITTDAMFDFAINGKGFFKVRDTRAGTEYLTRDGRFHANDDGLLASAQGFVLQPEMQIEDDDILSVDCVHDNLVVIYARTGMRLYPIRLYGAERMFDTDMAAVYGASSEFEYKGLERSPKVLFPGTLEMSTTRISRALEGMKALLQKEASKGNLEDSAAERLSLIDALLKKDIRLLPEPRTRGADAGRGEFPIAFYSFAEWSEIVNRLSRL